MKKILYIILLALAVYFWIEQQNDTYATDSTEITEQILESDDMALELPKTSAHDVILRYSAITVNYDTEHLIPSWVAYELTAEETDGDAQRASGFSMDLNYKGRQAMREDYSNSGWDKGHMAPAADMKWSQTAMYESFYLVNVCPQDHSLNSGPWLRLENWCRDKARKYGRLYIVTGPIIGSGKYGTIGKQNVAVPDRFFKALLSYDGKQYRAIAFVMDNNPSKQSLPKSCMTVDSLESLTGLDFFFNLPDSIENHIESVLDYKTWASEQ